MRGACVVVWGHAWFGGGICGCRGACVIVGDVWLLGGCIIAGGCMVVGGGHAWWWGGTHGIQRDMVNERAVRILLECILVFHVSGPKVNFQVDPDTTQQT